MTENVDSNDEEKAVNHSLVIAIDGPSGSGKSTTARLLAEKLKLGYLDTGAMYRAVAWEYLRSGGAAQDAEAIVQITRDAVIRISTHPDTPLVTINGHDVTAAIREPQVSASVSIVATNTDVRRILTKRMRETIAAHGHRIVVEGRDITTVVAPDADVRILLVADPAARVARRAAELGKRVDQSAVTDQVIRRDRDDSTVSNFTDATEGVVVIDSTFQLPDAVVEQVLRLVDSLPADR
ncbi:MAG: (d)CMP kinase [Arachnia sp.]